jgi:ketosteroid isomerase-like protein
MTTENRSGRQMRPYRKALRRRLILSFLVGTLALSGARTIRAQGSADERALWKLEQDYWRYVQKNDLAAYSTLWHERFLGWPSVSPVPVHKDHITNWITAQTSKGLKFISVDFKPAAIQVTGDLAVTCYWQMFRWVDKDGNGAPHGTRIMHTWLRSGKDWQIIGGMSMPEPATPPK